MKRWVREGAVCEVYGEGSGNLFVVRQVTGSMVFLSRPDAPPARQDDNGTLVWDDPKGVLGWKDQSKCFRTSKCVQVEQAHGLAPIAPQKAAKPPKAVLTVTEFIEAQKAELDGFLTYWRAQQAVNPAVFPEALSSWHFHFKNYRRAQKNGDKP